jgi:TetR/AcrR family transcriptional regulator
MQEIADKAGITKALVHYYFRSKEKLYEEVVTYIVRTNFTLLGAAIVKTDNLETMLRTFIDRFIDILTPNRELISFMLREMMAGAPVFQTKLMEAFQGFGTTPPHAFVQTFEEARKKGEIADLDPVHTLASLLGACVYTIIGLPVLGAVFPSFMEPQEEYFNSRKQQIFDLLYLGLKPRTDHP